jgi:hypothetical protein
MRLFWPSVLPVPVVVPAAFSWPVPVLPVV